jgi:ApaG protein
LVISGSILIFRAHERSHDPGIRIEVEASYISERSEPERSRYFFSYDVRISNVGTEAAQLVSRRWVITDGEGAVQVVEGPGVAGEQPLIAPGSSFEYTSFCPLPTPYGTMHGSYKMVCPGGDTFEATIAPFTLAVPHSIN